ncbi:MAG: YesL family protein [Roseburia sp.]
MGDILNVDNPVFKWVNKLVDCFYLGLLWFVCSIPIFTIGASTTALYYAMQKVVRRGEGYVSKEFFHSFKDNFKQSTIVWLLWLVIAAFLGADAYIMWHFAVAGDKVGSLYYLFLVCLMLLVMWGVYLFPYIARFENTTKMILKNAALIAVANIGWTVLLFITVLAFAFLTYIMPVALIFFMGVLILIQSLILEKVFRKYMSEEDRAMEDEKNRTFFE